MDPHRGERGRGRGRGGVSRGAGRDGGGVEPLGVCAHVGGCGGVVGCWGWEVRWRGFLWGVDRMGVLVGSSWLLFVCTRCVGGGGGDWFPFMFLFAFTILKKFISSLLVPPWP